MKTKLVYLFCTLFLSAGVAAAEPCSNNWQPNYGDWADVAYPYGATSADACRVLLAQYPVGYVESQSCAAANGILTWTWGSEAQGGPYVQQFRQLPVGCSSEAAVTMTQADAPSVSPWSAKVQLATFALILLLVLKTVIS